MREVMTNTLGDPEYKQVYQAATRGECSPLLPASVKNQLEVWARPGTRLFFRMVRDWCVSGGRIQSVYWTFYNEWQAVFCLLPRRDMVFQVYRGEIPVSPDYQDIVSEGWMSPILKDLFKSYNPPIMVDEVK